MTEDPAPLFDPVTLPPLLVAGASGHAAVLIEIARAEGRFHPVGCTAAGTSGMTDVIGVPVIGGDDVWPDLYAQGIRHAIVAIGDNRVRLKVGAALRAQGFALATLIHPAAIVSPTATIGDGVAIMAGAVVNARARVGDLAILNTRSSVDHDCEIGAGAHIAPGTTLAGNVRVGEGTFVGAGATFIPGVGVGAWSTVGAGSLVLRDLGANTIAYGVPAYSRPLTGA